MSTIVRESNGVSPELVKVKIWYPDYKYKEKVCESKRKDGEYLGEAGATIPHGVV
jgi:hypothetical protein